ncbi:nuclease-related domain-containing protein [uncultured Sunxiuqinia sp.]|uniref:nuclease-related domain-containing protein n=1 Tax=uncultured Sunxiuqinia sp. TaxID=1573825 RepID=UPI002AA6E1B7|nr:nuclease-related domain-containing protein [uncultured Sunxiuqinia sp.]
MKYSERVYRKLISEDATIMFIADKFGKKIIMKVPSSTARAMLNGCKVELIIGRDDHISPSIIHSGLKIYDDPVNFIYLTGAHIHPNENKSLKDIMECGECYVELYNEFSICVANTRIYFNKNIREEILNLLGNLKNLYSGIFDDFVTSSLDSFDYTIDKRRKFKKPYDIKIHFSECVFDKWQTMTNHFIGLHEHNEIKLDDLDEGSVLEKQAWTSIEELFNFDIYKNPFFKTPDGNKELTDILAFYQYGIFLLETKALAILSLEKEKSTEKKVASIKKQIRKGIKQLVGAKKNIEKGVEIYSPQGNLIEFERNIVPHCIVLISELIVIGDWTDIENEILETMRKESILLHVMDLREFMKYVKYCNRQKEILDVNLIERIKIFVKTKNIHIRIQLENK